MAKILIVDDEQSIVWGLTKIGESLGHEVLSAASAEEGILLAERNAVDLLLLDVRLPGMDGLSAMKLFKQHLGNTPVIIMTAFGALDIAVKTVQNGAFEYLLKPFDLAEVRSVIKRALRKTDIPTIQQPRYSDGSMVGETPLMQALFKQIALAAASDANVIISGESGVGKDLAARAVHEHSPRSNGRFVAVNVAALSPTLAESELFGHVAGAYTGANQSRDGLLLQADGGTLFLDEVADIPVSLQIKLLRAIELGEVLPVGADTPVKTNFRVVAASHQNLASLVQKGKFRHDFFYRICAFEINVPSLRDRQEDIPLLASHFSSQVAEKTVSLSEEVLAEMKSRSWYGNVRELRNAIEHASVLARSGVVQKEHLPQPQPQFNVAQETPSLAKASASRSAELLNDPKLVGNVYEAFLQEVEGPLLTNAMQQFDNECAPAARALGLHRTTLKKKLEQHRLTK